jgi:hypothetical protein
MIRSYAVERFSPVRARHASPLDFGSFKETVVRQTAVFVWMKTKKQGRNA